MTHDQVVACLAFLYPGVPWAYDGDGSTLDPVEGVSYGLVWHGDGDPPTLATLEAALPNLPPPPPSVQQKVAAALQQIRQGDGTQPVTADQLASVIEALS